LIAPPLWREASLKGINHESSIYLSNKALTGVAKVGNLPVHGEAHCAVFYIKVKREINSK